jgi:hypothetical protein
MFRTAMAAACSNADHEYTAARIQFQIAAPEDDLAELQIHPNHKLQNHGNRVREARNLWPDSTQLR